LPERDRAIQPDARAIRRRPARARVRATEPLPRSTRLPSRSRRGSQTSPWRHAARAERLQHANQPTCVT
jgi:hypothetical protein